MESYLNCNETSLFTVYSLQSYDSLEGAESDGDTMNGKY